MSPFQAANLVKATALPVMTQEFEWPHWVCWIANGCAARAADLGRFHRSAMSPFAPNPVENSRLGSALHDPFRNL